MTYSISGTVETVNNEIRIITINTDNGLISGTAPNDSSLNELSKKDSVVAVSLGEKGGKWVFIGKIINNTDDTLSACFGDIAFIKNFDCNDTGNLSNFCNLKLPGNFQISYVNWPDCNECSGCNCSALKTKVTLTDSENKENQIDLLPQEVVTLSENGYKIRIHFISSEASAYPQCIDIPCTGPQALSNFVLTFEPADPSSEKRNNDSGCFFFFFSGKFEIKRLQKISAIQKHKLCNKINMDKPQMNFKECIPVFAKKI